MSAFLFRKIFHNDTPKSVLENNLMDKMEKEPLINPNFCDSLKEMVKDLFPKGWDHQYYKKVAGYNLKQGSTTEYGHVEDWDLSPEEFTSYCIYGLPSEDQIGDIDYRHVKVVPDGRKKRTITIASRWMHLLAPLHHLIYDRITRMKDSPILRGDPTTQNMSSFAGGSEDTRFFVSSDYESSTDNLSSFHSKYLIRLIQQTSTHVPEHIWDLAVRSLTGFLYRLDKNGDILRMSEHKTGQLMGNFLSFPLLCLQNLGTLYCADATYARSLVKNGQVKINGDDLVYRSDRGFYEKWKRAVPKIPYPSDPADLYACSRTYMGPCSP
jgi:hypothetical protein